MNKSKVGVDQPSNIITFLDGIDDLENDFLMIYVNRYKSGGGYLKDWMKSFADTLTQAHREQLIQGKIVYMGLINLSKFHDTSGTMI